MGKDMRRTGIAAEAGFTLIEVLAACMVLLTGVLGAAELTNVANKSTNISSARNGATSIARRVAEAARGVPARNISSAALMSTLRAQAPDLVDANPTDELWTVDRRNFVYTISATVCTLDDASDGLAPTAQKDTSFCNQSAAGTTDLQPADFQQVTVKVSYKVRNKPGTVQQVTQVPVGANTSLPGVSQLRMTSPTSCTTACPVITNVNTAKFQITPMNNPATMTWLLQGSPMATCPQNVTGCTVSGSNWTFDWSLGAPVKDTVSTSINYQKCIAGNYSYDGLYDVGARVQDAGGLSAGPTSMAVRLNRCAPIPPPNMDATGRDATTPVIDVAWNANPEGDIVGYRVYKGTGSGASTPVCPASVSSGQFIGIEAVTECTDMAPPAYAKSAYYYAVVALDRDTTGALREGATSFVNVNTSNKAPNAPTTLAVTAGLDGRTLTFRLPSKLDPDNGDTIESFRIYRKSGTVTGSPAIADRIDREDITVLCPDPTPGAVCTYKDPTGLATSTYWVSSVDSHMRESAVLGPKSA
jgi:Tfp pilus assembly protein PilV